MTSPVLRQVMQQKYLLRTKVLSNHGQNHRGQSQRPKPKIRAMPTSTRTGSPNGQGNRSQNRQGQSQQSEPQQPVPPRPPATIRAIIANTTSGPQQPGQPQPEPEQLRPTADIEAYKEPSPPVRTQALLAPSDKDAETEQIIKGSTAATTNFSSSVNTSSKEANARKLPHSLNKSTAATAILK